MLKQDLILQIMNFSLKEKNKKVTGLMKDEFGRKIMTGLLHWDQKYTVILTDGGDEDKKAKDKKKCVLKWKLKFEDYVHCLEATQSIIKNSSKTN